MLTSRLEYNNTCAIRMSVAMKGAGVTLPRSYREAIEGDGSTLIIKVETLSRFLNELLGKPGWNRAKRPGEKITLPATKGIVMYRGDWGLATGHVDLWTGTGFVGEGNPGDMLNSHYVALWPLA